MALLLLGAALPPLLLLLAGAGRRHMGRMGRMGRGSAAADAGAVAEGVAAQVNARSLLLCTAHALPCCSISCETAHTAFSLVALLCGRVVTTMGTGHAALYMPETHRGLLCLWGPMRLSCQPKVASCHMGRHLPL